jgi:hypothetical protein
MMQEACIDRVKECPNALGSQSSLFASRLWSFERIVKIESYGKDETADQEQENRSSEGVRPQCAHALRGPDQPDHGLSEGVGWTNPKLIDGENGVIAGYARIEAAKRLGLAEVPCIELTGLTEAQKKAYVIADNKLALNAGWDDELLRLEMLGLKDLDFNLDLLGFDATELADITLGKDVNKPEYDESVADEVTMMSCPKCGHSFPK